MRIEYHRTLIADKVRNDALYRALKSVIKPGITTIADIGAGTGLLGLMALKLGAKAVFLYETAEVASVAAKILKANRAKTCHLFPCHSTEMQDPPKVDVIISETLGNYALEENIIDTLNDARRRFLKPGGLIIPHVITQYVAPVTSDRIDNELQAWDRVSQGIDFSVAKTMSLNNIYVRSLKPAELLLGGGSAIVWDQLSLDRENKSARKGEAVWTLKSAETVYGFAIWWRAELVPGITLSTAPDAPTTHWEQLYLPLLQPIAVMSGQRLALSIRSRSSEAAGTHIAWTATHLDASGKAIARQALDLDKGFLP